MHFGSCILFAAQALHFKSVRDDYNNHFSRSGPVNVFLVAESESVNIIIFVVLKFSLANVLHNNNNNAN